MEHLKTGEVISKRRKELGLTRNQLAKSHPDIEMLPKLAAALHTTVDALLGYRSVVADYDKRYEREDYYWGLLPNRICYDIMKLLPPIKPYRVLDIGCGEGRNAIFLAGLGHTVDAFDISAAGIEKAREIARLSGARVNFFRCDLGEYIFEKIVAQIDDISARTGHRRNELISYSSREKFQLH